MPQAIGTFILTEIGFAAFAATTTGALVASAIGSLALIGASLLASPGGGGIPKPEDGRAPKRQSIQSRCTGVGEARPEAAYMLYEEKDGTSYDVLAWHDGKITEITHYFLTDDEVTLSGGYVDPLADGQFGINRVSIETRWGEATETAYSDVVTALPGIWTNDHRGDGIASVALTCRSVPANDFTKIYPNGLPIPTLAAKLSPLYDPRDLAQDFDDPSTWVWSDNPVLGLLFFLTLPAGAGYSYERDILPEIAYWRHAADVCDEAIDLAAGGTQPRYTCNGYWRRDNDQADVIAKFLMTFDGWLGETDAGTLRVFAGEFLEPTDVVAAEHIKGITIKRGQPDENKVNQIIWTYTDPSQKFAEVDGDPWRVESQILSDGGERNLNLPLNWTNNHPMGRRLAKRAWKRANAIATGTIYVDLMGLTKLGRRFLKFDLAAVFPSLGQLATEIQNVRLLLDKKQVAFDIVAMDASIDEWDKDEEEGSVPEAGDDAGFTVLPEAEDLTPVAEYGNISTGGAGVRLAVTFDTPDREDLGISVLHRVSDTGSGPGPWQEDRFFGLDFSDVTITVRTQVVDIDSSYDVMAAYIGPAGSLGNYSDPETVSTSSSSVAPTPNTNTAAAGHAGNAVVTWRNSTSPIYAYSKIYRGATTSFGSAADISGDVGTDGLGADETYTDTVAAGTYHYWSVAFNSTGVASTPDGPQTAIVT